MDPIGIEVRPDGWIGIAAPFRDRDNIKLVPGKRWVQDDRMWKVPCSWAAMQQLRGIFGQRLVVGDTLAELATQVFEQRVAPALALRTAQDCEWVADYCRTKGGKELTPLQRAAVGFLVVAIAAVEGDPMGSGKTPITICALKYLQLNGFNPFPALILCNFGAKAHWRDEVDEWWPDAEVSVMSGNIAKRRKALEVDAPMYALNWESLTAHTRLTKFGSTKLSDKEKEPKELNEIEFHSFVCDEAHRAKDPKAKQTKAAWTIGDQVTASSGYIFALTGSLIEDTPVDLWGVGRTFAPKEYPAKSAFIDRYALMDWNDFGGKDVTGLLPETREELFRFLDPRHIRRPKSLILPELEGKLPVMIHEVELAPKQKKAYDAIRKEALAELDSGTLMAKNPMTVVQRLRQAAGATLDFNEDGGIELKDPSSKIDDLLDVIEESAGEQVCVYAESRLLLELAAQRLTLKGISNALYTGKVGEDEKEARRVAFQNKGTQILLLTYGAGAESINLSAADILVRLEYANSSIKNSQAAERPDRPGREGPLRTIDIVGSDTLDADIRQSFFDKLDRLEELVRDEDTLRKMLA